PASPKTFYGPVVTSQHMEKVTSYIRLAQEEGAKVEFLVNPNDPAIMNVSDDGRLTIKGLEGGYFIAPTLITNIKQSSRVMQEEIFGPVVCVVPFDTEEEGIQLANDTKYGLGASVWTGDQTRLERVMRQLNAGSVWGNSWLSWDDCMPFGGMGCSGTSREHGPWSLEFYTETKA
ncbi:Aldehyde dehydrogenase 8 member A1, partial [Coemansia furcata]